MPTSDFPFARQLHADRTARIISEQRLLHLPSLHMPRSLFTRKERRQRLATQPATTC
jgi:hypothetical protein